MAQCWNAVDSPGALVTSSAAPSAPAPSPPRQYQNLSILARVLNKADRRERLTRGPTLRGRYVSGGFARTRMHIANNFLMRFIVENKSEVQLITKKGSP